MTIEAYPSLKIGLGYDFHRYSDAGNVVLGGFEIEDSPALIGHSDADVLTHAVMDSILGAAGESDIGELFPDTDETYKGACSVDLAGQVMRMIREKGFEIVNIDAVVICDRPKISKWKLEIRSSLAQALDLNISMINLKGKTNEGLMGRESGVEVQAVALLKVNK